MKIKTFKLHLRTREGDVYEPVEATSIAKAKEIGMRRATERDNQENGRRWNFVVILPIDL